MKRGSVSFILAAVVLIGLAPAWAKEQKKITKPLPKKITSEIQTSSIPKKSVATSTTIAVIETSLGQIIFKFYPEDAPKHVANFIQLARSGFYNGTTFHRVIPGFMIQGGDPNSKDDDRSNDGTGGPGYLLKAEFNKRAHLRGTVSMARGPHPDTAGSQFFICVAPQPFLDGQYTVFGQVIKGMDVVDTIVNVKRDIRDNPLEKVVMKTVSIKQK